MLEDKVQWADDYLWSLLNLDKKTLERLFPRNAWEGLRRTRNKYRTKIKQGVTVLPERPSWYQEGMTADDIFARLEAAAPALGNLAVTPVIDTDERERLHTELDKIIDQGNQSADAVDGFDVVSGTYEGQMKDAEGNAVVTELHKRSVKIRYRKGQAEDEDREFVAIQRFESEGVDYSPAEFEDGQWRRTVVLPDFQIGYWNTPNGRQPFHDEDAINVMLQVLAEQKAETIDHIVLLGDFLDFPQFGKYRQEPQWMDTLNASLEYGHNILLTLRKMFPEARISLLEGNHDARFMNDIKDHYPKLWGAKRGGTFEELITVPSLLGLDTLGVEYFEGYPAARVEITKQFMAIHGEIIKKGATAKAVVVYEGTSTIHGHTHRYECYGRTQRMLGRQAMRQTFAFSPGTLSSINGSVPSVHGGRTSRGPVDSAEDWQQGFAFVDHDGDNFQYNQVFINTPAGHLIRFEGKTYRPSTADRRGRTA